MKNSELKSLLKTSYRIDESASEKQFIREHEKRSMQFSDILKNQLEFMGLRSVIAGAILCIVIMLATTQESFNAIWIASSILPLFVLVASSLIDNSERFEMDELEASCRFSLRFVRLIRMLILGVASLLLIIVITLIAQRNNEARFLVALCAIASPYLLNVFGCLLATRKIHSKRDLLPCAIITAFTCWLPRLTYVLGAIKLIGNIGIEIVAIIALSMALAESILYIKEGDKIKWNYC